MSSNNLITLTHFHSPLGYSRPTRFVNQAKLFTAVTLALLPATALLAQDRSQAVEEVVVTSSRLPIPLRQIGTSVTVVTEADIEARGNLSIADVLRQTPAIAATNTGGPGKTTTLRIRGEEGFRTLTMLDGIRLSDPSGPQIAPQMEHIISNGIHRVEVLRGPQGLSYGADAGGVVNMSTRPTVEGQGLNGNVDAQAGRFNTRQFSGNVGGDFQQGDFFLSAADLRSDGFNAMTTDPSGDDDGYRNTTLHGRVGLNVTEALRVDLVHRDVRGQSEYDGCFMGDGDCVHRFDQSATRLGASYAFEQVSHRLSYATTRTQRADYTAGEFSFGNRGELNRWEYLGTATDLPGFNLVWGADHEEAINDGRSRDNLGVFGEYLSTFSDSLFLTAGLRYDDNDDFGSNTSYRLSVAYLVDLANGDAVKLKSSYGTGFRAPSPFEVAYNAGPNAFPPAANVQLLQETSRGYEAGLEYLGQQGLHLEAVYFDQRVEDAIFFDLASFSGYLQDVGTSHSRGVELSAQWPLGESLRLVSNYTWNDSERPNGMPRLRRPEHLFNAGLSYQALDGRMHLNGFYRLSRNAWDQVGDEQMRLDNFGVLDLTASYALTDSLQVYGRIENVGNEDYQEVINYNTPGRTAYVGFRMHFAQAGR